MRNLITQYSFVAGTRTITIEVPTLPDISVQNIRLIVNETQKKVIASSMTKDNIASVTRNSSTGNYEITYADTIPALASGDLITLEIDTAERFIADKIVRCWSTDTSLDGVILTNEDTAALVNMWNKPGEAASKVNYFRDTNLKEFHCNETPNVAGGNSMFANCSKVEIIDFPGLKKITRGDNLCANCSNLRVAKFPNLSTIGTDTNVRPQSMFAFCPKLEEVDLTNLPIAQTLNYINCFNGTPVKKITVNTAITQFTNTTQTDNYKNIVMMATTSLTDLYLVGDAINDVYLTTNSSLNFESIKRVLTVCNTEGFNGHTVSFYSSGLTIQDDADGTLETLYESVVNHGGTIANLTITPYSA